MKTILDPVRLFDRLKIHDQELNISAFCKSKRVDFGLVDQLILGHELISGMDFNSKKLGVPNLIHCSKSQISVQIFNFDKTPTFSRVFHQIFF